VPTDNLDIITKTEDTKALYAFEKWVDIAGYEGYYQISNQGRVKTVQRKCLSSSLFGSGTTRTVPEKIRKPNVMKGYHCISLIKDGKHKVFRIHRLVAEHFIGEQPTPDHQINHIDGDKANNNVGNLEWVLPVENTQHAIKTGLRKNPTQETKRKIGQASQKAWRDDVYRRRQSERMLSLWSDDEYRQRTLQNMRGKVRTEEQKRRYASVVKPTKAVLNIDTGEIFESRKLAALRYGITPEAIGMMIRGASKTCAGYRWRYVDGNT
jgi:hypothetical protein